MILDDLKEQTIFYATKIGDRIVDMPLYQQGKERFDSFSYPVQKAVIVGAVFVLWLMVLMVPYSWYSQSQENVATFEDRRSIIRELLKVSREAAEVPAIPMAPPVESMRADLDARMKSANLLPEQVKAIEVGPGVSSLIPADRAAGGLNINLWKLNVRQVVDVGTQLSRLSASVKLTALEMTANTEDARYFDVKFHLTALAVPDLSAPPMPMEDNPRRGGGRGKKLEAPGAGEEQ